MKKIFQLLINPLIGKPLKNNLKNERRLRIEKYRVIYSIENQGILIAKIGHRKNVYRS